jgi:hypothetical protein
LHELTGARATGDEAPCARRPAAEPISEAALRALAQDAARAAAAGRADDAREIWRQCLDLVLGRTPAPSRFHAGFVEGSLRGVKTNEFLIKIDHTTHHLYFSPWVVGRDLRRVLHRLEAVRRLCATGSVLAVSCGQAVWDFSDHTAKGTYPRIAFCSNLENSYLVADSSFLMAEGYSDLRAAIRSRWVPWHERSEIVFWRGSTTGRRLSQPEPGKPITGWRWHQRLHLCETAMGSALKQQLDIGVVKNSEDRFAHVRDPVWANSIEAAGFVRGRRHKLDYLGYRYLIDIDGNGSSWSGLFTAMLMGATILKVTSPAGSRQWYYDKLIPWENYIPVKADLSDFDERVAWALSHPDQCAEMGRSIKAVADAMTYRRELRRSGAVIGEALASATAPNRASAR